MHKKEWKTFEKHYSTFIKGALGKISCVLVPSRLGGFDIWPTSTQVNKALPQEAPLSHWL